MIHYCLGRLLSAGLVVAGVVVLVFLLVHLVPGDPVEVMLGEHAQPADRAALREALGLDRPLADQLLAFAEGLLRLDLGTSLHSRRPIEDLLAERIPASAALAAAALSISLVIGVPLGVVAAMRKDSVYDRGAITVAMLGAAVPNFVLGPLLILLGAVWLGWFPVSGNESAVAIVLPALTLGTSLAAILSRMVRSSLLEVMSEDYVRTARAKGLPERRVVLNHALRNATLPVVTVVGLQLGALLAGTVITETVFSWPGIGLLTVESIQRRDYPVLQACVLLVSVTYVVVNTLTDLAYAWLDPRIRLGG